jgi:hypothetical protein
MPRRRPALSVPSRRHSFIVILSSTATNYPILSAPAMTARIVTSDRSRQCDRRLSDRGSDGPHKAPLGRHLGGRHPRHSLERHLGRNPRPHLKGKPGCHLGRNTRPRLRRKLGRHFRRNPRPHLKGNLGRHFRRNLGSHLSRLFPGLHLGICGDPCSGHRSGPRLGERCRGLCGGRRGGLRGVRRGGLRGVRRGGRHGRLRGGRHGGRHGGRRGGRRGGRHGGLRRGFRGGLARLVQLAQPPGVALAQAPCAVPLMLAPELLCLRRIIAAQRAIPQVPHGEQCQLRHAFILRAKPTDDDNVRPNFRSGNHSAPAG